MSPIKTTGRLERRLRLINAEGPADISSAVPIVGSNAHQPGNRSFSFKAKIAINMSSKPAAASTFSIETVLRAGSHAAIRFLPFANSSFRKSEAYPSALPRSNSQNRIGGDSTYRRLAKG